MLLLLLSLLLAPPATAGPCLTGVSPWYTDADGDGYGVKPIRLWCNDRAHPGWAPVEGDCDDQDPEHAETCEEVGGEWVLYWGDVHAHSSLSADGCEDESAWCGPREQLPGADVFQQAESVGLDFAGSSEHAEHARYSRPADGVDIDIWAQQQEWVVAADGGNVVPVLGYEFTAPWGHPVVVLDTPTACPELRKSAIQGRTRSKAGLGLEIYSPGTTSGYTTSAEFEAGMLAAAAAAQCQPTRWMSWFHHPAYPKPALVDWTNPTNQLATDRVVEIASEHGSSECTDLARPGCDYPTKPGFVGTGSAQTALSLGLKLGFVGGTDTHDGRPGSVADGPSYVGNFVDRDGDGVPETPGRQFGDGVLTGVLVPADVALTRSALFDAIDARHTLAATWPFDGLSIQATAADGTVYLPGADVPAGAGPLTVVVTLDDTEVTSWYPELVEPDGGQATELAPFELAAGDIVYLRIRAWIGTDEHRVWASPWFGE